MIKFHSVEIRIYAPNKYLIINILFVRSELISVTIYLSKQKEDRFYEHKNIKYLKTSFW